jgi:hypothetical protein
LDNIVKQQTTQKQPKNNLNINIKKNISIKNNIHKENEKNNSELDNKEKPNELEEIKDNSEADIEELIDKVIDITKTTIEKN